MCAVRVQPQNFYESLVTTIQQSNKKSSLNKLGLASIPDKCYGGKGSLSTMVIDYQDVSDDIRAGTLVVSEKHHAEPVLPEPLPSKSYDLHRRIDGQMKL